MYRPSPDLTPRIYTPQRIAAVVHVLGEDGIPPSRALNGTGLKGSDLKSPDTRVSYQQVETVFRNAFRLSKDPAIALRAGQRMHVISFGLYGYALLSSPTRADGIDFAAKYSRILGTVADVAFSRDDETALYTLEPLLSRNPIDDIYRFALEFAFAAYQTMNRDVYGRSFNFSRLRVAYPTPAHVRIYRQIFRCPIAFDQTVNELEFDVTWIDHPMVGPDPITYVAAAEMCAQFLGKADRQGGVAADIRRNLLEHPGHFPSIEAMASELSVHPRTLRRRLEAESISYRDVVAELRMTLALEYLRNTRTTNEEIAARLDYSDAANFRHAFARWTGKSPSDFSNRIRAQQQKRFAEPSRGGHELAGFDVVPN
jgi:AraC-like DNA-binding protein